MTDADVIVSWLPLYHDMGFVACFLMPLLGRMRLVELSPFDWVLRPALLLEQIHSEQGTLCWLPNFAYSFLARSVAPDHLGPEVRLDSIRAWINCSEPVMHASHEEFVEAFESRGVTRNQLSTCYGMAENVFAVSQASPGQDKVLYLDSERFRLDHQVCITGNPHDKPVVSNGSPIEDTEVRIIGKDDEALGEDEIGEIVLRGGNLFAGYHRRDDLNQTCRTSDGWYRTGDLGFIHASEIYVTGRKKDLIIIQGRNFYPVDIEEVAAGVDGIKAGRVVAFGVADETLGTEKLVILAESEIPDGVERKRLALRVRNAVAQELDCTPAVVRVVASRLLVKSSSGKLARSDNREKFLAGEFDEDV